jgi:hypothetical protein
MKTSPILQQIDAIWKTLRHPETSDSLLQSFNTLWLIISRIVLLLFLLALLVIAAAVWLWGSAFQKGREYREWLAQEPQSTNEDFLAKIGQDLQAFFKGFADFSGTIALKLLGVQDSTPTNGSQNKALPSAGIFSSDLTQIKATEKK